MKRIERQADFFNALSALSVCDQRRIGMRFIGNCLQLATDHRIKAVLDLLSRPGCTAEDLHAAHTIAHTVYVETNPASDQIELDFIRQAGHFVAEATVVCTAPLFENAANVHLAQKVATYCRMATTCASVIHDDEGGADFSQADGATKRVAKEQLAILNDFLAEKREG